MNFTEEIKINTGLIRGEYIHDKIATFKGIPFAKPPVENLRFKRTEKAENFDGVKDCVEFGSSPIQKVLLHNTIWTDEFVISNQNLSEDVLTLNLWTDFSKNNMPVIVYLYGGGHVLGGSSCEIYDGTTLAENGVIYVTFNHREGVLGLYEDNNLLYDEIEVLKWIHENISAFGGNPNNVTLMGQSTGSIEVNALATSKLTKGLIKKVIAMSFNTYINFGRGYITKDEKNKEEERVLTELGKTHSGMLTCDAKDFIMDNPLNHLVIDGNVIEDNFDKMVDMGVGNDLIYVMGAVPGDNLFQGLCAEERENGREFIDTKDEFLKLCKNFFADRYDEFCKMYDVDNKEYAELKKEVDNDFLISSLLLFKNARQKTNSVHTYIYYYIHPLPGPLKEELGVFHSAEIPYFFNVFSDIRKDYWKDEDREFGKYLCGELANFAKDDVISDIEKVPEDKYSYLEVSANCRRVVTFDEKKYKLFEYAFKK